MATKKFESLKAWRAEATRRFGDDFLKWRFVCPACGHIASAADYKAAGAPSRAVAFSCIGRFLPKPRDAFDSKRAGPCNYAGGGLLRLNPVEVRMDDGETTFAFDFAEESSVASGNGDTPSEV
jgi:hypothetical protein